MSSSTGSRYCWGPIRSNRHKIGKRRDASAEHLLGRLGLLRLDLLDISRDFDLTGHRVTLRNLNAEMTMIEEEIALRSVPQKPKKPRIPKKVATFEAKGLDALAELADIWAEEPDA